MKICVIGNSHVASLKEGYDSLKQSNPRWADIDLTFFAARAKLIMALDIIHGADGASLLAGAKGSELETSIEYTSGGKKVIDLRDYDHCLLYGAYYLPQFDTRISGQVRDKIVGSVYKPCAFMLCFCEIRRID